MIIDIKQISMLELICLILIIAVTYPLGAIGTMEINFSAS